MRRVERSTLFIVNPASANGRTDREWRIIEKDLYRTGHHFVVRRTTRPLEAIDLTRNAIMDGYERIISVGGDGTINEVLNGFYASNGTEKINPEASLSAIPMGTGSDFSRVLHLPSHYQAIHEICQGGREIACDVVRGSFTGWQGEQETRHFINIADVGLGSETVLKVNRRSKRLGGFLSFLLAAISAIVEYKNKELIVKVDESVLYEGKSSLVAIGNGQYFGGGMRIAPSAQISDGLLEVVILKDFQKMELIRNLPQVYKGKHIHHPKVSIFRGKKIEISSSEDIYLEMDGESPGRGNCKFEVIPGDMKIIV